MSRLVTLFTGQWADLPLEDMCRKASDFGYQGLELACWGDHFAINKAAVDPGYAAAKRDLLDRFDLQCQAISSHLVGQAVCDRIDARHQSILPPHVWGDGDPSGVNRRAAEDMKNAARAAQQFGVGVVNGFTGSSIWPLLYSFPPVPDSMISAGYEQFAERWNPILDVFGECGVRFALEVHPTEIAFDIYSAKRASKRSATARSSASTSTRAISCGRGSTRSSLSASFPTASTTCISRTRSSRSTAGPASWQATSTSATRAAAGTSARRAAAASTSKRSSALNQAGYEGPLSVEWEDVGMDREHGAREACEFVRKLDFEPSRLAFDAAFAEK